MISDNDEETTPFSLCRVVSREYHVGEKGMVIGSGLDCDITLPLEAGLDERHVEIKWISGKSVHMTLLHMCIVEFHTEILHCVI